LKNAALVAMFFMLPAMAAGQLGSSDYIVAEVPFRFMVGNRSVPAGTYIVKPALDGCPTLAIENERLNVHAAFFVTAENTASGKGNSLVFHKYGEQYFLSGIRLNGSIIEELPESKQEADLHARNITGAEKVSIATLNHDRGR
jgi:hypothetical protein